MFPTTIWLANIKIHYKPKKRKEKKKTYIITVRTIYIKVRILFLDQLFILKAKTFKSESIIL